MKKVLVLISLLVSANLFAGDLGPQSSWAEIDAAYSKVVINSASVSFDGRSADIMKVCFEGDMVRTIKKVKIYEMRDIGDRTVWEEVGFDYLYTPKKYTTEYCAVGRGRHCRWVTEEREYPESMMINVNKQPRGDRSFGPLMFRKLYTVPSC